jgi:hypothetical protein
MSKFHLSQELTNMISNAVEAFALRLEKECKVSKDTILEVWEKCSDDIVTSNKTPVLKKVKKADDKKMDAPTVQKLVKAEMPERRFALRKNQFGHYEHKETGFVFDPHTKAVWGKQVGDQVRTQLSLSDVELCKQFGFKFTMPEKFDDEVPETEDQLSDVEELGMNDDADDE